APRPQFRTVFSAFCVGLFANAVLPGRVGEVARVAVLARRMPGRQGIWATLLGTVFAHRMFDLIPATILVVWVLSFADLPHWAVMTVVVILGGGGALFIAAIFGARTRADSLEDGIGRVRLLPVRGRAGLAAMRRPLAAGGAAFFQLLGWVCQLFAVYAAMRGFRIYEPLVAAGLVLLMMNVVTVLPFWPGDVGLVQAAVAVSLAQYGVRYAKGFALGIRPQLIAASVGLGLRPIFLPPHGIVVRDAQGDGDGRGGGGDRGRGGTDGGPRRRGCLTAYRFGTMKNQRDRFGAASHAISPLGSTVNCVPDGASARSRSASSFASSS